MKPAQAATSLTIANYNDTALFMQVRVYRWERKDGTDILNEVEGNDAPLITPPLFRLAPGGGSQVVRIGFQKSSAARSEERQWRVIIEEVPKAPASAHDFDEHINATPGASTPGASTLATAPISVAIHVRVSLPLFERPALTRQDLQWGLARSGEGAVTLTAENVGTVTERLDNISLTARDSDLRKAGPLYIFPGERRAFEMQPGSALPTGTIHLSVQGTPRPLARELVLIAQ